LTPSRQLDHVVDLRANQAAFELLTRAINIRAINRNSINQSAIMRASLSGDLSGLLFNYQLGIGA